MNSCQINYKFQEKGRGYYCDIIAENREKGE